MDYWWDANSQGMMLWVIGEIAKGHSMIPCAIIEMPTINVKCWESFLRCQESWCCEVSCMLMVMAQSCELSVRMPIPIVQCY